MCANANKLLGKLAFQWGQETFHSAHLPFHKLEMLNSFGKRFLLIFANAAPKTLTRSEQSSVSSPAHTGHCQKMDTCTLPSTTVTAPGNKPWPPSLQAYRWVGQEGCGPKGWWINWWVPWLLLLYPCPVLLKIFCNTVNGRQETHQQIFIFFFSVCFFFFQYQSKH